MKKSRGKRLQSTLEASPKMLVDRIYVTIGRVFRHFEHQLCCESKATLFAILAGRNGLLKTSLGRFRSLLVLDAARTMSALR